MSTHLQWSDRTSHVLEVATPSEQATLQCEPFYAQFEATEKALRIIERDGVLRPDSTIVRIVQPFDDTSKEIHIYSDNTRVVWTLCDGSNPCETSSLSTHVHGEVIEPNQFKTVTLHGLQCPEMGGDGGNYGREEASTAANTRSKWRPKHQKAGRKRAGGKEKTGEAEIDDTTAPDLNSNEISENPEVTEKQQSDGSCASDTLPFSTRDRRNSTKSLVGFGVTENKEWEESCTSDTVPVSIQNRRPSV